MRGFLTAKMKNSAAPAAAAAAAAAHAPAAAAAAHAPEPSRTADGAPRTAPSGLPGISQVRAKSKLAGLLGTP